MRSFPGYRPLIKQLAAQKSAPSKSMKKRPASVIAYGPFCLVPVEEVWVLFDDLEEEFLVGVG